jgi:hypothetical protein
LWKIFGATGAFAYLAYGFWSFQPPARALGLIASAFMLAIFSMVLLMLLGSGRIVWPNVAIWGPAGFLCLFSVAQFWLLTRPSCRALFARPSGPPES